MGKRRGEQAGRLNKKAKFTCKERTSGRGQVEGPHAPGMDPDSLSSKLSELRTMLGPSEPDFPSENGDNSSTCVMELLGEFSKTVTWLVQGAWLRAEAL